jgi:uncharacterized iron-regulated protein
MPPCCCGNLEDSMTTTKPVMKPVFWQQLAEACPQGPTEPEIAKAWFDLKWPVYQTYGYRSHKRAIAKWWSRVNARELEEAEQFLAACNDLAHTKRLDALYHSLNKPIVPDEKPQPRFTVHVGGRAHG